MTAAKPLLIALACALLLILTEQLTRETIRDNTVFFETRLLREMVPNADITATAPDQWLATQNEKPVATISAIETNEGYNGRIALLVAISTTGKVLNIRATHHRETPGLGDFIDHTKSSWLDGFTGRSLDNTSWALMPDGDIDGVSGATITARATTRAIAQLFAEQSQKKISNAVEVSK